MATWSQYSKGNNFGTRRLCANFSSIILCLCVLHNSVTYCAAASTDFSDDISDASEDTQQEMGRPAGNLEDELIFDSRKHLAGGDVPRDFDPAEFPTVPEPDLATEVMLDRGGFEFTDYENDSTKEDPYLKLLEKFYRGPVCALVDARNTPEDLRDLENCTIVNGFVQITFMPGTTESSFEQYSFPKLRVITEYLLIYRVYGLRSLRKLFPNLSVIRGRQVFYNYGMIIYENPQLQEIGLENLRHIERGGVRIQKNSKLCYLDTVDWERLGVTSDKVISDNALSREESCLDQCSDSGKCVDNSGTVSEHCWGHEICQKQACPEECPNACEDGQCVCHEECLGGCIERNNASACRACLHRYHDGECVRDCPEDTYLENEWKCITRSACIALTWIPHEFYDEKEDKRTKKCIYNCPANHHEEFDPVTNESYCKDCKSSCNLVCKDDEYTITDSRSTEAVRGCTSILGKLEINHLIGDGVLKELDEALSELEEVGSLSIRRADTLVSLNFLKKLKRITGRTLVDNRYSLFIINNPNLQRLFPNDNSSGAGGLRIDGGKVFFHFNSKLCMKEIERVSALTAEEEDDKDISVVTNGDRGTCDMMPLIITSIEHMPMKSNELASVRIQWDKVDLPDKRTLIGYQIFHKESEHQNAKRYEGRNVCSQTGSGWEIKDALFGLKKYVNAEDGDSVTAHLHNLKPYTQYAMYVMTYTTSSVQKGAQSNITYFTTKPSKPSEPYELRARAINSSAIRVQWKPPVSPNGRITHYVVRWRKQPDDEFYVTKVDTCKREKPRHSYKKPTVPPTTTTTTESDKDSTCECPLAEKPDRDVLEERANNEVDFENFLQRSGYTSLEDGLRKRSYVENGDASSYGNNSDGLEFLTGLSGDQDDYFPSHYYAEDEFLEAVAEGQEIVIANLLHYSEYEVRVHACNHAALNDSKMCSYDAMTAARTYFRPGVDDIDESSLKVAGRERVDGEMQPTLLWEPPQNPNGYVKSYDIDVKDDSNAELSHASRHLFCYSVLKYRENNGAYVIPSVLAAGPHRARIRADTLAGKGNWTKYVKFDIPQSAAERAKSRKANLEIGIAGGIALIIIVAAVSVVFYRLKKKKDATKAMIYSSTNPEYVSLAANYIPDDYEVDVDDVELTKFVGNGNFGKVYVGYAKNVIKGEDRTVVAIKKLHEKSGIHRRFEFLEEAKLMKAFNATHVVRLLGVVSQTSDPMVIMEYMEKGDLKAHLRSRREDAEPQADDRLPPPNLQEQIQMAAEIADGMAYLADIKYVHRDLAARNCLVSKDGVVKIGDFGLARDVYETDYYRKDSRGLLPIRWMAPESLRDGVFDFRTDVWSYGVVIWEIATLAEQPYQGRQQDEVVRYVIDGGYMERPKRCPTKLYELMLSCWEFNPDMRPRFEEILCSLASGVSDRFKQESYFFEESTLSKSSNHSVKAQDRGTEEDLSYSQCDDHYAKEPFRMVLPARSGTPTARYSNGSGKAVGEMLAHCDHLKRIDAGDFQKMSPCARVPASKESVRMKSLAKSRRHSHDKPDTCPRRASGNPAPRAKFSPPAGLRKKGDRVYHAVSTGSLGANDTRRYSDGESVQGNERAPISRTQNKKKDDRFQSVPVRSGSADADKPYALMNGFAKRLDSVSKLYNSHFRRSGVRTTSTNSDESYYVESSPLGSAKYPDPNRFPNGSVEIKSAPPPPTSPPPAPPVGVSP